jgi:hypothetical protein
MNKLDKIIQSQETFDMECDRRTAIISVSDCRKVALEFAKHILEEAAENAQVLPEPKHEPDKWQFAKVDKESIKSVLNKYLQNNS